MRAYAGLQILISFLYIVFLVGCCYVFHLLLKVDFLDALIIVFGTGALKLILGAFVKTVFEKK